MPQTISYAFKVAFRGIGSFFRTERNGKIHLAISIFVVILSTLLKISATEWMFVLMSIAIVIVSEMLNTAVEKVCDLISKTDHPEIKMIKDISAGAVLFASIMSIFIGCIIFLPKLFSLF
jgi:diacylglycerol kinase